MLEQHASSPLVVTQVQHAACKHHPYVSWWRIGLCYLGSDCLLHHSSYVAITDNEPKKGKVVTVMAEGLRPHLTMYPEGMTLHRNKSHKSFGKASVPADFR